MNSYYDAQKGMYIDGSFWLVHPDTGERWNDSTAQAYLANSQSSDAEQQKLQFLKEQKVAEVKRLTYRRLTTEQWQLERAQERLEVAKLAQDSARVASATEVLSNVLAYRESLRQASNDAEAHIMQMSSLEELSNYHYKLDEFAEE
ncbi:hypothetical protein [Pseudoalteromonas sp. T1lg23B]|uniref:hypothetical protein n=1 Tax=Pseudoalteromonas sp. T1lg23B TaxID=2077097 RepID=UPI000CF686D4|nr:hypothetical protein [Pseudoalteromonas sp. T1lg23B]